MRPLYHYTCEHHAQNLARTGRLVAGWDLAALSTQIALTVNPLTNLTSKLIWMTDLPDVTQETAHMVGLTMELVKCDRTEYRFRVLQSPGITPFDMLKVPPFMQNALRELRKGVACNHIFVGTRPVQVVHQPHIEGQHIGGERVHA